MNTTKVLRAPLFEDTKTNAVAFVIKNSTSSKLKVHENYFRWKETVEYEKIVVEIPPKDTKAFGFTHTEPCWGFFSYKIADVLFIVQYYVHYDSNSIALAFAPRSVGSGEELFRKLLSPGDWYSYKDRTIQMETSNFSAKDKELNVTMRHKKLQASAKMKTGKKALVTMEISEI